MSNALQVTAPEGLPFVEFTRELDFPVEAVFRAHADPELYRQWIGPRGLETEIVEHDFRSGGSWRFVQRQPAEDGGIEVYGFHGVFHTVRVNEYALQTFEFEGFPDVVNLDELRFERLEGGRTRLVGHSTFPSVAARDGMVASGMEGGMREGYERLEELLAPAG